MNNRLYIGNLSYSTGEDELRRAFAPFGKLASVVVTTGKSRGFGFVEYQSASDALRASESLDGLKVDGRTISVRLERRAS
jgi:cold-inducible RNA-binding protein